jgi:hypothetical protein
MLGEITRDGSASTLTAYMKLFARGNMSKMTEPVVLTSRRFEMPIPKAWKRQSRCACGSHGPMEEPPRPPVRGKVLRTRRRASPFGLTTALLIR